jgi:hypothetical protein
MDVQAKLQVPGEFRVIRYEVPDFVGDWRQIEYGDPNAPRIAQLREEFKLEEVVAGCASEFAAQLALKRWVRSQWNHGYSRSATWAKDGLDILHEVAKGEQFCCGAYARVLMDCATALGWPARPVGLCVADCEFPRDYNVGNVGHAVCEVWSNGFRKWVLMDPDVNVHYERDGVPLSALEIHDAWVSGCADEVRMVADQPGFVIPTGQTLVTGRDMCPGLNELTEEDSRLTFERFGRHRVMDYYARLNIAGRQWADQRCLPTFVVHFGASGQQRWTSDVTDLYWPLNLVRLSATPAWDEGRPRLTIELQHCMPFFDHYEARVDGEEWQPREAEFEWPMHDGVNTLQCRAVNVRNVPGIVSRIEVAYSRPRW